MPRRIRLRQTSETTPPKNDGARRAWIASWKRWAVNQLPPDMPREVRVQVRAGVERVVARFGPGDDEEEIRDVILAVVEDALRRLQAETEEMKREETKRKMVAQTSLLLRFALRKFPRGEVRAMLKRPGYSVTSLTEGLRGHLEQRLTGEETLGEVMDRAVVWVERRLAEQPRVARLMKKAGTLAIGLGALAVQDPEVREAAVKGFTKARDTLRDVWARWITASKPANPDMTGDKPGPNQPPAERQSRPRPSPGGEGLLTSVVLPVGDRQSSGGR